MKGNRLYLNLPMEILSSIKKDSAVNDQYEEPRGLYILALCYKDQITKDYGAQRAEEIINKYKNMTMKVSAEQKRLREEDQKRAEIKREARDQREIERGKRAQIRIEQRNRELNLEEEKLQHRKPKRDKAWEKQIAEDEASGLFKKKTEAPKPTPIVDKDGKIVEKFQD